LNEVYQFITSLVHKCGVIITEAYFKEKTFEEKENFADFVTETDKLVERTLIESIRQKYPDHNFIGEESTSEKLNFSNDPVWIIDPIDGTTNFVHRYPYCAISIALAINKEPQLAIVYNPIAHELYSAIKGQGAYLNGRSIRSSGQTDLKKSQIITEFGGGRINADMDIKVENMRKLIERVHSIRCLGSAALNSCYVANSCADLYFEYGIHIWDVAAAVLIAKEAGCFVFDPVSGKEDLNLLDRRVLISSSRELAASVIPLLKHVSYESD